LGAAILAAAAVLVVVNVWAFAVRGGDAAWTRAAGGDWAVGEWLRTGAAEHVEVASDIGRVTVGPGSRVRLVRASPDEHRLELVEGRIEALIFAPPRLFFVDTPAATAVDMGCAYTLDVAADGGGLLRVTGGWVELQAEPVASRVPAGAVCRIFADGGPGLPRFEDGVEAFAGAVERFESGDRGALEQILASARPRDGLTLWHLLGRTEGAERGRVAEALGRLVPAPSEATAAGARVLDGEALEDWWSAVRRVW
jgi:hypothetical protein